MSGFCEVIIKKISTGGTYSIKFSLDAEVEILDLVYYIQDGTIPDYDKSKVIINSFERLFGDRTLYKCEGRFYETIYCFDKDLGEGIIEEQIEEFILYE